jgi:transposase-like protein
MSISKQFHSYRFRSEAEKIAIVREAMLPGVVRSELQRREQVSSTLLYKWINKYGDGILGEQLGVAMSKKTPTSTEKSLPTTASAMEKRIAELEKALYIAELKAELFETMVDIAETELKIPIRKKYGPQQLKSSNKTKK